MISGEAYNKSLHHCARGFFRFAQMLLVSGSLYHKLHLACLELDILGVTMIRSLRKDLVASTFSTSIPGIVSAQRNMSQNLLVEKQS